MLKINRVMCLLSCTFLFNIYSTITSTPFCTLATDVVEDNNIEMVHKNNLGLIINPIQLKYEKDKAESDIIRTEKFKQEEIKKQKIEPQWEEFILTFYTSLESENSSAGAVTCQNKPLSRGGVANNIIPQNTELYLEGYGKVIVNDKGSNKHFNVDNRLDVFIEREPGENDRQYAHRVNSYGVQKVNGYILK